MKDVEEPLRWKVFKRKYLKLLGLDPINISDENIDILAKLFSDFQYENLVLQKKLGSTKVQKDRQKFRKGLKVTLKLLRFPPKQRILLDYLSDLKPWKIPDLQSFTKSKNIKSLVRDTNTTLRSCRSSCKIIPVRVGKKKGFYQLDASSFFTKMPIKTHHSKLRYFKTD